MGNQRGHTWNGHGFSKRRISRDEHIEMQNHLTEWMKKMISVEADIMECGPVIEPINEIDHSPEVQI